MPKCKSINRKCNSLQLRLYNCPFGKYFFLVQLIISKKYIAAVAQRAYLPLMMKTNLSKTYCSKQQSNSKGSYANLQRQKNRWCKHIHWNMQHTEMKIAFFCLKKKSPQKQSITAQHEISLVNTRLMPKMCITRFNFFQAGYSSLLHIPPEQLKMAGRKCSNQDV